MVKICVIALIGLPGAGKTTFCKNMVKFPSEFNVIHICYDEIFHFDPECNECTFKNERRKVTQKIEQIIDEIKSSTCQAKEDASLNSATFSVILIDDNNYYVGMRYEIYKICKTNQLSFGQIYFPVELECALARNATRSHNVLPFHVIEKMNNRLESPSDKNQWEKNTLIIHNSLDVEQFWTFLNTCILTPVKRTQIKKDYATEVSFIHEVDICLRKRIKQLLLNSEENLGEKANILNKRRKSILLDIKNRNVIDGALTVHIICERLTL